jgi:ribosome-associated protein
MARYDISAMLDAALSKTKKKQQMHELQALGAELVELSAEQLAAMRLPVALLAAALEAQRITAHEGRRRQIQYIGKLMRQFDPAPIREQLAVWQGLSRGNATRQHALERWRERLLADDEALTEFARERPGADLQALRALIRNARKEAFEKRPPRAFRELFRVLRETGEDRQGRE